MVTRRTAGLSSDPTESAYDGTCVEGYFRDGKIQEIASYCEGDVIHTYRVWLRYELFRGRLSQAQHAMRETHLNELIDLRSRRTRTSADFDGTTVNLPTLSGA